jgi:hypothetical protein
MRAAARSAAAASAPVHRSRISPAARSSKLHGRPSTTAATVVIEPSVLDALRIGEGL